VNIESEYKSFAFGLSSDVLLELGQEDVELLVVAAAHESVVHMHT
jgi:hypothetical protein